MKDVFQKYMEELDKLRIILNNERIKKELKIKK